MTVSVIRKVAECTMNMDFNVDKKGDWDWGAGVALYGLRRVYEKTGDKNVYNFIKRFVDYHMEHSKLVYTVNTTAPLLSVVLLYKETGNPKYLDFCETFAAWIMQDAPRTVNRELEHTVINADFSNEIWVDTIFMAGVFLVELGCLTQNERYIEEGIFQATSHMEKLLDPQSKLLYHGFSYQTQDYLSGCLWGRGNSWAVVSVAEIVELLRTYPGTGLEARIDRLCRLIAIQVEGIVAVQADNGLWHTVMNDSSSYCETSASAGFVYGMRQGVRLGYLPDTVSAAVMKGYHAVIEKISAQGVVTDTSIGTGIHKDIESYYHVPKDEIMPWGQGLALLMLSGGLPE
ncbi:glycoside hydrolase family 88 protein [Paenibacillus sp. J5C_2022]|uniref:glycoside hydrolase family 88/105 protein n=1 Tax=Paenibacillus sp. J5C2022 TaxID=2977129 RepID=UPI0021D372EF|nr:glycoside hydrolase family 88 protein [Paenibacillus sp. J5C2022]MCU6712024.1 glycoside hydrolase family 88 protein [Paenibacillus sp. J5C2022]